MSVKQRQLSVIVDEMGYFSGIARNLAGPVTTTMKLIKDGQRLYILQGLHKFRPVVVGILKVAIKRLFIFEGFKQFERNVLCIMDFYIVCDVQRKGYGKKLFDFMAKAEHSEPRYMAYDAASPILLSFLKKHYALDDPVMQPNRFVTFNGLCDAPSDEDLIKTSQVTFPGQSAEKSNKKAFPQDVYECGRVDSYNAKRMAEHFRVVPKEELHLPRRFNLPKISRELDFELYPSLKHVYHKSGVSRLSTSVSASSFAGTDIHCVRPGDNN